MEYQYFEVEDFSGDEFFIRSVVAPTSESDLFWKNFLSDHPHKEEEVKLAREFVKMIRFQATPPSENDLIRLKKRIWNDIEQPKQPRILALGRYYWIAASVALLASIGIGWSLLRRSTTDYQTKYAQIQQIELPDGSHVTLNANSSLRVIDQINQRTVREVWLDGEAFFDVAKLNKAKFIVHTPETDIEVLGTEFNVNTRRKKTKVVLNEGKVQLHARDNDRVVMKPGDMATVTKNKEQIRIESVLPQHYDAWKESYVVMDEKPVSDIVEMMEDSYGTTLQFSNPMLLNKKLSGKLPIKDVDDFMENLAIILEVSVQKTDSGYLFE